MAKAKITTPEGIEIAVEGTPKEISAVIHDLKVRGKGMRPTREPAKTKRGRLLLVDLVASLKDGGFFKKPRDLASIKSALEEMGHHYPVTTISPTMLRQVRHRKLRRIRQKGRWLYTG